MEQRYPWSWVEAQVAETIVEWNRCALPSLPPSVRYTRKGQRAHEKAYDEGLRAVQREGRRAPRNVAERLLEHFLFYCRPFNASLNQACALAGVM
jgi:hypothetical protein